MRRCGVPIRVMSELRRERPDAPAGFPVVGLAAGVPEPAGAWPGVSTGRRLFRRSDHCIILGRFHANSPSESPSEWVAPRKTATESANTVERRRSEAATGACEMEGSRLRTAFDLHPSPHGAPDLSVTPCELGGRLGCAQS